MQRWSIYRTYDWVNRHAAIVTVVLILGIIGIGAVGVLAADTSELSFDLEAEVFTVY